jgi:predicted phage gp36 major capsid-like protein
MSYFDNVVERRDAVKAEMDAILEAVATEKREDLTAEESAKFEALVEESRSLDSKIEKFTAEAAADAKAAEARASVAAVVTPVGGTSENLMVLFSLAKIAAERSWPTFLASTSNAATNFTELTWYSPN